MEISHCFTAHAVIIAGYDLIVKQPSLSLLRSGTRPPTIFLGGLLPNWLNMSPTSFRFTGTRATREICASHCTWWTAECLGQLLRSNTLFPVQYRKNRLNDCFPLFQCKWRAGFIFLQSSCWLPTVPHSGRCHAGYLGSIPCQHLFLFYFCRWFLSAAYSFIHSSSFFRGGTCGFGLPSIVFRVVTVRRQSLTVCRCVYSCEMPHFPLRNNILSFSQGAMENL